MHPELNLPSPVQFLLRLKNGIEIFVKREDLIHPEFGGNKWRKLKGNIEEYRKGSYDCIVSFGGAFSNHIAALSSVAKAYEIPLILIVRGEDADIENPTLSKAREAGARIHLISRSSYKMKLESPEVQAILSNYPNALVIPEGGANNYAESGLQELANEIDTSRFDCVVLPAGTGTTAAGLIKGLPADFPVYVVNALKNPALDDHIHQKTETHHLYWEVWHDYHFGGFAKVPVELLEWNQSFYAKNRLILDPVYNAKAFYGLLDRSERGYMGSNTIVLYLHTGGLQGIQGFESRYKKEWLPAL